MPVSLVRFRPLGPWRIGPDSGARDRVDLVYHSDALFSAVTQAMALLGSVDEWLDAVARNPNRVPDVRFGSMFPFVRNLLLVTPPRSLWPPAPSVKIRYKSARFVPVNLIESMLAEQAIDENRWAIDAESRSLIASGSEGPFRVNVRSSAAVDRLDPALTCSHSTACIEFRGDSGLWTLVVFANDEARSRWQPRVRSALRLLADSGFGGERSRGWGRSSDPEWSDWNRFRQPIAGETAHWLLSLYSPAAEDAVDWNTGNYSLVSRSGRAYNGELKRADQMIEEGSVLVARNAPRGEARKIDVNGSPHPIYRAGFAVTIPIPWKAAGAPAASIQAEIHAEEHAEQSGAGASAGPPDIGTVESNSETAASPLPPEGAD